MRKKISTLFLMVPIVPITAFFLFCDLGDQPLGPEVSGKDTATIDDVIIDSVTVWKSGTMEIFVNPSEIPASSGKTAVVTVRLFNNLHNPIVGRSIFFAASHGLIEASAVTDTNGIATAAFTSEPINTEASIYAYLYEVDKKGDTSTVIVKQTVTISGIDVQIIPSATHVLLNTVVPVTITVTDAEGKPVANKPVYITGTVTDTLTTLGNGNAATTVTSSSITTFTLYVQSQGAYATETILFDTSISDIVDTTTDVRSLRIFSSKSQLKADNTDYAIITAILINEKNNPAVGDTIMFEISDKGDNQIGIIGEFGIIDSTGRTSVILRSAPVNGTCKIYGFTPDQTLKDSTTVLFSGVSLQLTAVPTDLKTGEYSTIQALLTDASGHPIEGDEVTFFLSSTNTAGKFDNDSSMKVVTLNTSGIAEVRVTSTSAQSLVVYATALNCRDSTAVNYTNNILTLAASPTIISIGGSAYSTLTATYRNASDQLVNGAWIHFYTNAGSLSADSAITAGGIAKVNLYSGQFTTTATVKAVAPNGSAETTVQFASINAASIELKISPDNINVNGGVATLTATVRDPKSNMVSGAPVNFRILQGPGGSEYINNPMVISKDGIARSKLYAGTVPGNYRAVEVSAYIGSIADTTKMTISGEPYVVTVSRPQDDTVVVSNVGQIDESTFKYFAGAVVQDVNGNNVADGIEVHFSAVVSGEIVGLRRFVRWAGEGNNIEDIRAIMEYVEYDIPFEDINNNFKMDPNIDFDLDFNPTVATRGDDVDGNGTMDYNKNSYDLFFDYNLNGVCDVKNPEPCYEASKKYITDSVGVDTVITVTVDTIKTFLGLTDPDTVITGYVDTTIIPIQVGNTITWDTTVVVKYDTVIHPPEPIYQYDYTYHSDTVITIKIGVVDSTYEIWADLNKNGVWDKSELYIDHNGDGICDMPASGDFSHWLWEMRPQFEDDIFDFSTNDFAVVIEASAVTKDGVAYAALTYPRQMANRLIVTVNAECNGIRDKDGERFGLPVLIEAR